MDRDKLVEKLLEDPIIAEINSNRDESKSHLKYNLIGGAVIDILEDRKPKDYDFLNNSSASLITILKKIGFKYSHSSKTATTYSRGEDVIQILKTNKEDFEYTISQATLVLTKKPSLQIDEESFEGKVLIPIEFDRPFQACRCLIRKPHWERKGYVLPEETYYSLVNILNNKTSRCS